MKRNNLARHLISFTLLIAFAVAFSGGCSSSNQSEIEAAVRSTLAAATPTTPAAATPTTPPNPELNIYVTHIGTTKSHSQLGLLGGTEDNLRLFVRILDGANRTELYLPPEGVPARTVEPGKKTAISMDRIQIQPESNSITLEVIAYQEDDFSGLSTLVGFLMGNVFELEDLITESQSSSQDIQATYIGHFQIVLSPSKQWGQGTYEAVGGPDLRLWLEIESDGVAGQKIVGQPFPTPTPVPTQIPISDLIGKWQLVENNELLTNGLAIEFHPNGTITFLAGIGAQVEASPDSKGVIITKPLPNTPAEKAGIKAGDRILAVDGEDATGWSVWKTISKIRGEKGTSSVLTVEHVGSLDPVDITIIRDTKTPYEKGSYSSVPTGGVHLTISNGFLNYIDSDYEMRIVGDYLYLERSSFGFSYGHKWVRVK